MKYILFTLILFFTSVNAQNTFKVVVRDSSSSENLIGVNVVLQNSMNGASTDVNGIATLKNIPDGEHSVVLATRKKPSRFIFLSNKFLRSKFF